MIDTNDFSDVLADAITVERTSAFEFEFDGFVIRREGRHWEIQFEDEDGEQGVVIEREDFAGGKFVFDIDGRERELPLEDFDRVEKFAYEAGLIG